MNIEYHKYWSPSIGHDMEFKVYGHEGKPILVFPSSGGNFYEYEDFGMVEACRPYIDAGSVMLFTVDSLDQESWLNRHASHNHRAARHAAFEQYILSELYPYVRDRTGCHKLLTTGCSLGAFHAVNFLLKHPALFDSTIALSGIYSLRFSVGDYMDSDLYYNSPLHYLPNLNDPYFLDPLRLGRIILCSGQGAWEQESLEDTYALNALFETKDIPAWMDIWGSDAAHDWPWWRLQMPYFLGSLGYQASFLV